MRVQGTLVALVVIPCVARVIWQRLVLRSFERVAGSNPEAIKEFVAVLDALGPWDYVGRGGRRAGGSTSEQG